MSFQSHETFEKSGKLFILERWKSSNENDQDGLWEVTDKEFLDIRTRSQIRSGWKWTFLQKTITRKWRSVYKFTFLTGLLRTVQFWPRNSWSESSTFTDVMTDRLVYVFWAVTQFSRTVNIQNFEPFKLIQDRSLSLLSTVQLNRYGPCTSYLKFKKFWTQTVPKCLKRTFRKWTLKAIIWLSAKPCCNIEN